MSASPVARQVTQSQAIPRRVTITSATQLPNEYSTTPGGTIYSTTPGGTRIVYERAFLMQLRNSPLARTPPKNMHVIPGLTSNTSPSSISPSKLIHDNGAVLNKLSKESGSPPVNVSVSVPASGGGAAAAAGAAPSSAQQQQQPSQEDQFQMEL